MAKGFLFGATIGGAVAYLAYRSMSEEQRQRMVNTAKEKIDELKDRAVDYAFYAMDSVDELNGQVKQYQQAASETVRDFGDVVADKKDQLTQRYGNSDFEAQTKTLRDELVAAEDENDDIVIDADEHAQAAKHEAGYQPVANDQPE